MVAALNTSAIIAPELKLQSICSNIISRYRVIARSPCTADKRCDSYSFLSGLVKNDYIFQGSSMRIEETNHRVKAKIKDHKNTPIELAPEVTPGGRPARGI